MGESQGELLDRVKQATLETLGYLCEEISANVLSHDQVNSILTAVVQGSDEVRLYATRALNNAIVFAESNFNNESERDYILKVVCEATTSSNTKIRLAAFWSTICDEEIDILEGSRGHVNGDPNTPCFYFIKQALPVLVPMLLETLLKQEDGQDQDEGAWNISMAGGTCLGLIAKAVGDEIVPFVVPFVEENITKPEWRKREAATYAFGSILEGPSPLDSP